MQGSPCMAGLLNFLKSSTIEFKKKPMTLIKVEKMFNLIKLPFKNIKILALRIYNPKVETKVIILLLILCFHFNGCLCRWYFSITVKHQTIKN